MRRQVTGLRFRSSGGAAVELDDGSVLECDTLVSALPNRTRQYFFSELRNFAFSHVCEDVLAPLIQPHNERLGNLLAQVKSTSLAVVNFGTVRVHAVYSLSLTLG